MPSCPCQTLDHLHLDVPEYNYLGLGHAEGCFFGAALKTGRYSISIHVSVGATFVPLSWPHPHGTDWSFAALTRRRTNGPRLEHTAIHGRHGLFPGRWHVFLRYVPDNRVAQQTKNTGAGSKLDHIVASIPIARAICRAADRPGAGKAPKRLSLGNRTFLRGRGDIHCRRGFKAYRRGTSVSSE